MDDTYTDSSFWEAYEEFAASSRSRHRNARFSLLRHPVPTKVLDLGAGRSQIARHLFPSSRYIPVDKHPHTPETKIADFSSSADIHSLISAEQPDMVTSLFAVDVLLPAEDSAALVREILDQHDCVTRVILAGFYYDDERRLLPSVEETHGLVSYQVPRGNFLKGLRETRVEVQAPSALFGPTVIEVWRMVQRETVHYL